MKPLIVLIALLAGCETSAVWYANHPEKQTVSVDGREVSVVPRGENKFDAWGSNDGTATNMVEYKARAIRAVEQVSKCKVTGAEFLPGTYLLQTVARCS